MNPTSNHKTDTIIKFNDNVKTVLEKINDSVNKLLPENINPPVDKLIYEDEIQPITNTDTFDDHSYME
nr:MAG TPA: hypothetical protein [Bacteriophage sp.]